MHPGWFVQGAVVGAAGLLIALLNGLHVLSEVIRSCKSRGAAEREVLERRLSWARRRNSKRGSRSHHRRRPSHSPVAWRIRAEPAAEEVPTQRCPSAPPDSSSFLAVPSAPVTRSATAYSERDSAGQPAEASESQSDRDIPDGASSHGSSVRRFRQAAPAGLMQRHMHRLLVFAGLVLVARSVDYALIFGIYPRWVVNMLAFAPPALAVFVAYFLIVGVVVGSSRRIKSARTLHKAVNPVAVTLRRISLTCVVLILCLSVYACVAVELADWDEIYTYGLLSLFFAIILLICVVALVWVMVVFRRAIHLHLSALGGVDRELDFSLLIALRRFYKLAFFAILIAVLGAAGGALYFYESTQGTPYWANDPDNPDVSWMLIAQVMGYLLATWYSWVPLKLCRGANDGTGAPKEMPGVQMTPRQPANGSWNDSHV